GAKRPKGRRRELGAGDKAEAEDLRQRALGEGPPGADRAKRLEAQEIPCPQGPPDPPPEVRGGGAEEGPDLEAPRHRQIAPHPWAMGTEAEGLAPGPEEALPRGDLLPFQKGDEAVAREGGHQV